ncbi:MAG TPA: hypothetical protein VMT62_06535 [Syntrophorhabdaceae bacterium]|nr:hypothetical protein [Syntrophorhabdaceae bacterium]
MGNHAFPGGPFRVVRHMLRFMTCDGSGRHIRRDVHGSLKRDGRIIGPILIFAALSGLALVRRKVLVIYIPVCRCAIGTRDCTRGPGALRRGVEDPCTRVDAIDHTRLSA